MLEETEVCVSKRNGPGSSFHDVKVTLKERRSCWSAKVTETWGSDQGRDQVHGQTEVVGFGPNHVDALGDAETRAEAADVNIKLLSQAISQAREIVEQAIEDAADDGTCHSTGE
jgi:hypothetical protein